MTFTNTIRAVVVVSLLGGAVVSCGGNTDDTPSAEAAPTEQQIASLRDRWNTAAGTIKASTGSSLDFTWTPSAFPAPTFRGGSHEAYEQFAEILILFYSTEDNLAFAKTHGLLTYSFSDGLGTSGNSLYSLTGITTSLTTNEFLAPLVDASTIAKLKTFCPQVGCGSS